jgi:RNA polymerase sigma factor (sigma-70 family)
MEALTGAFDRDLPNAIASAAAGDEVAFGRIVAAYHGEMHRVCVFVCGDQSIAEEAVQAAWTIAWKKLDSVRDAQRLRPWLTSIAVNQARDLIRKRRRRSEIEVINDASAQPGGIDPATGIEAIDLRAALKALDPDERALLAMRYVAGFNATEISGAVGISPSGVRNRLERLTSRLRQELDA